ncbi:MAG: redoxin domain-containing protein, partial [Planctomycetota bacterium]
SAQTNPWSALGGAPAPHSTPRREAVPVEWDHGVHLPVTFTEERADLQAQFDLGLAQVLVGAYLDAERSFRTVLREDPDCAMALWGVALANPHQPARAAWYARAAWLGRGLAGPMERALMDGLAEAWGVAGPDERPSLVEPRSPDPGEEDAPAAGEWPEFGQQGARRWSWSLIRAARSFPDEKTIHALQADNALRARARGWRRLELEERKRLLEALGPVEFDHATHRHALRLWDPSFESEFERVRPMYRAGPWPPADVPWGCSERAHAGGASYAIDESLAGLRRDLEYAQRNWMHPTDIPGFLQRAEALAFALGEVDAFEEIVRHGRDVADLPRRPPWSPAYRPSPLLREVDGAWVEIPDEERTAAQVSLWTWTPPAAPDFTLPDAYGGEHSLQDHRGHPVLVVHFLGLGCVHCLEQLQALLPFADDFADADIRILAIGLQEPEAIAESLGPKDAEGGY